MLPLVVPFNIVQTQNMICSSCCMVHYVRIPMRGRAGSRIELNWRGMIHMICTPLQSLLRAFFFFFLSAFFPSKFWIFKFIISYHISIFLSALTTYGYVPSGPDVQVQLELDLKLSGTLEQWNNGTIIETLILDLTELGFRKRQFVTVVSYVYLSVSISVSACQLKDIDSIYAIWTWQFGKMKLRYISY